MAVSQPSALVQQLRNKVADQVFYTRNGVTYVRARVSPDNTRTAARDTVRTRLSDVATIYRDDLTRSQRLAWAEAAKTIGPRPHRSGSGKLTGWMYFHNVNLVLENLGVGATLDPPQRQLPDPILSLTVDTLDAATQTIKLNATGAEGSSSYLIVYATPNTGPGRLSPNGVTRQIAVIRPETPRPFDISAAWTSKFGTLLAGSRVVFQAAQANSLDGQLSPRAYATAIATGETDAMQLIQAQTLEADAAEMVFDSIPQTYRHLLLQTSIRSAGTGFHGAMSIGLTLNDDTGANYDKVQALAGGYSYQSAQAAQTLFSFSGIPDATADANRFGPALIHLLFYSMTDRYKDLIAQTTNFPLGGSTGYDWLNNARAVWRSTSGITKIALKGDTGTNLLAGSTGSLYGIS